MGQAKKDRRRSGSSEKKRPSRGMLKKKASHNSIGKIKAKRGSAARFMTRSRALRSLQVPLKDFRRLCILKGIYPRDPPKKFSGADKTYYYTKDILYLQHEPLLAKFREMSALLKKVVRRADRGEKADAVRLYDNRPVYRLDHLIRERYPSFTDALRDLDDALCLVHLFACVPSAKLLPPERIANCARLCKEFQAVIAHSGCVRAAFISIKGIYVQAEVHGVKLLWLMPHSLKQEVPADVDLRVLLTFLELYEVLLQFVNYKLFTMRNLQYPPLPPHEEAEPIAQPGLARLIRRQASTGPASLLGGTAGARGSGYVHAANLRRSHSPYEQPGGEAMARFRRGLKAVERAAIAAADAAEGKGAAAAAAEEAAVEAAEAADGGGGGDGGDAVDGERRPRLFDGLSVLLGRETPMAVLELLLASFGATVAWEGEGSSLEHTSPLITHEIVDRPSLRAQPVVGRVYAQPQWVFDCINAGELLPVHAYAPGCKPPPHLSPFGDGAEGYVPPERRAHPAYGPAVPASAAPSRAAGLARGAQGGDEGENEGEEVDVAESDDEPDGDDDDESDDDDEREEESDGDGDDDDDGGADDDEEGRFRRELEAERRGVAPAKPRKAELAALAAARRASSGEQTREEKTALSQMLMKKRDARLYKQMQHGINRKQQAADKLAAKRHALVAADGGAGARTLKGKRAREGTGAQAAPAPSPKRVHAPALVAPAGGAKPRAKPEGKPTKPEGKPTKPKGKR